jgi:hypothetical protein
VLSTIVAKAAPLSGTEAGAIYVFGDRQRQFHLRATNGMYQELIEALTHQRIGLDDSRSCRPWQKASRPGRGLEARSALGSGRNRPTCRFPSLVGSAAAARGGHRWTARSPPAARPEPSHKILLN